ncbi:MAG: hypothetical protein ACK5PB_17960 [Pirellula sp.]
MSFWLQDSAPNLMNLNEEIVEKIAIFGYESDKPFLDRACLLARRMIKCGVRFITI